ncbi:MAG TPA: hypothetical protein VFZ66_01780 [Herpetosiphonaceae bacterium]
MEQNTIKAVEMTRAIRDKYADELQGKSPAEIIAFYQQKAQALHTQLNLPMPPQHTSEEPKTPA